MSPFKLAIDWENWDCLDVLLKYLDPRKFYTPLQFCFLHKDLCPDDSEFCDVFPYRFVHPSSDNYLAKIIFRMMSPLSSLLSERLSKDSVSKLHLFKTLVDDRSTLPPLVSLLAASPGDVHSNIFSRDSLHDQALTYLMDNGATLPESDLLPLILFGSLSGVFRLVTSGVINPHQLVDPKCLRSVRDIITDGFSRGQTGEQVFEMPLVSQRLLNIAIIVTHCGLLESDWVQTLALLVLDQMKRILSIDQLVVIDNMYKNLKVPKSLQQLSRNEVLRNVKNMPRVSIPRLRLPQQIQGYLLYEDIDVDVMIKEYKDTIDHINDNGVSNVVHV